jgi:hypothetical protein
LISLDFNLMSLMISRHCYSPIFLDFLSTLDSKLISLYFENYLFL